MPRPTDTDEKFLLFDASLLLALQTTCALSDEPVLTWAGAATVFTAGGQGRLCWKLTNRDGSAVTLPTSGVIAIYNGLDNLIDSVPVCIEQGDTMDPLFWNDYGFSTGGVYRAKLTIGFADGSAQASLVSIAVSDVSGWARAA